MAIKAVGRAGQVVLIVSMALVFALVGNLVVDQLGHGVYESTGGTCVSGSPCSLVTTTTGSFWPWLVIAWITGAAVGVVFALGLIYLFRLTVGRKRTDHPNPGSPPALVP